MWAKHKLRRDQNIWCNSNRDCGYIPIDDQVIHRIGLRGRKRYILYGFIALLGILTLLNLIASLLVFFAFKLYNPHQAAVDYWSTPDEIKFNENVEIRKLVPYNDELHSHPGQDLTLHALPSNKMNILSVVNPINQDTTNTSDAKIHFDSEGTSLFNTEQFVFSNPNKQENEADSIYFSGVINGQHLPFQPNNIGLKRVWTPKIHNEISNEKNMTVKTNDDVKLRGNQGIIITSTYLNMSSFKNIRFRTKEGSIILKSPQGGIFFPSKFLPFQGFNMNEMGLFQPSNSVDNYDSIPTTRLDNLFSLPSSAISMPARKLCVCGNTGRLFSVPILSSNTNCINGLIDAENPCLKA